MMQAVAEGLKRKHLCPICGAHKKNYLEAMGVPCEYAHGLSLGTVERRVTHEDLENIANRITALTDSLRSSIFPHGKPDWMNPEEWTSIGGN